MIQNGFSLTNDAFLTVLFNIHMTGCSMGITPEKNNNLSEIIEKIAGLLCLSKYLHP